MQSFNSTISSMFANISAGIDKNLLQIETKQILVNKRLRCNSEEEYMEALVKNVAFSTEYANVIKSILFQLLCNKHFPHMPKILESLEAARINIKNSMSSLSSTYAQIVEGEKTKTEKIAKLEMVYSTAKLDSDFLAIFLDTFGNRDNRDIFRPLFNHDSKLVVEVIEKVSTFYACMLFDGVFIVGNPIGTNKNVDVQPIKKV